MVEDPAHYRWTSYRANALGQQDGLLTAHPLHLALGQTEKLRREAYRALFRPHLDTDAIGDIRLALNQSQPLGNARFYAKIEKVTGQRREPKPRGRPRVEAPDGSVSAQQRKFEL
jgi:putative transposase